MREISLVTRTQETKTSNLDGEWAENKKQKKMEAEKQFSGFCYFLSGVLCHLRPKMLIFQCTVTNMCAYVANSRNAAHNNNSTTYGYTTVCTLGLM